MKIVVAGIGYVGLSNAILLAQHHCVTAVDIAASRVEQINRRESPLVDKEIEEYLRDKPLDLQATTDGADAYKEAEYIIIATPTNYDTETGHFDTSSVEDIFEKAIAAGTKACFVVKSTVPVGYTVSMRQKYPNERILFSPEFLREGKALYDNLYPSRIVVGTDLQDQALTDRAWAVAQL